jgi:3-methyladenine DNA glycosylase AlkD
MTCAQQILARLKSLANAEIASHAQSYFKTAKGEYGENDRFLGIRVPILRREVKRSRDLPIEEALTILQSEWHEARLFALLVLVARFRKGDVATRGAIYRHYMRYLAHINNWDLIDSSAPHIVGAWLSDKDKGALYKLVQSENLWHRRIAVVATFYFIRQGEFDDALHIAETLLGDRQDLIHKAVGWMLREVGKRDAARARAFLDRYAAVMPRTMLRYAIERFAQSERRMYLAARHHPAREPSKVKQDRGKRKPASRRPGQA